ncbi:archease [Trinickia fusca]|uniref:Archease n=1 Tax=Trinickia fusca TaxID=2419777 RepID=A0A494X998_9BURK|nr:archease [Trinickia fusca]RKP47030.1 archease [Trinickia fusca]
MAAHWEHFHHDADIGVRGLGATLDEAYAQAALALTAIVTDPALVRPMQSVGIACHAPDRELLLVDWLNAVTYEMAVRHVVFSRFDVALKPQGLTAHAFGEALDRARHHPAVEPKGATYTELIVRSQSDGTWLAQCVIDV